MDCRTNSRGFTAASRAEPQDKAIKMQRTPPGSATYVPVGRRELWEEARKMGVGPYDSLISLRAGGDAAHLYAALFLDEIEVGTGQRRKVGIRGNAEGG